MKLSQDLIFSIVDQAKKMKVFKIQYMGGEPLCREDFGDILFIHIKKGYLFIVYNEWCLFE